MAPLVKDKLFNFLCLYLLFCGKTYAKKDYLVHFESLHNFIVELRDSSDTLQEYLTKIQVIFCPEQPICNNAGIEDRNRILNNLPQSVDIGTSVVKTENITDLFGICCLPCSCSDTCSETGYCCLSKVFKREKLERTTSKLSAVLSENGTQSFTDEGDTILKEMNVTLDNRNAVKPRQSYCMVPSAQHYDMQFDEEIRTGFFMITRCFDETFNKSLVQKCEHPNIDVLDETVPVTSLRTRQTYWNRHCALCNNDAHETLQWNSTGYFGPHLVFFSNNSLVADYPQTIDELQEMLIWRGDINYSPPLPMEDKRCINNALGCRTRPQDVENKNITWLLEGCEQFTSPILKTVKFGLQFKTVPYRNLLCFFCRENKLELVKNAYCNMDADDQRTKIKGITALLDYRSNEDAEPLVDRRLEAGNGNCPCSQIYDKYLDSCRPVFCPPGEFTIGCQCMKYVKMMSGMKILLYLKVEPKSGQLPTMTPVQIRKYNAALAKTLENAVDGITSEVIATFKQETDAGEGYLSLAVVQPTPDHDTKQTVKPFLEYLDSDRKLEMKRNRETFSVRLTSRIRQWVEIKEATLVNKMIDLELEKDHFTLVDSNVFYLDYAYAQINFQIFTPLLYCRQLVLEKNEFTERAGNLIINITSSNISIPYYYRIDQFRARVCVRDYLRKPKNKGAKFAHELSYILLCNSNFAILLLLLYI